MRTTGDAATAIPAPRSSPEDAEGAAAPAGAARDGRRRLRVAAVVALAVLLVASVVLLVRAAQLNGSPSKDNKALVDAATTGQVVGDVSDTLGRVLSYSPDGADTTAQDARELLGGKAAQQYEQLFSQVRRQVVEQRVTLTTRVVRAGVTELTAHRARVLVFLDQVTERSGQKATTNAAQLSVTAEPHDGHWLITDMKSR
ncbi:hypothetical protein RKE29_10325 [Streptomyces sp. B1866]|uniref:hypothetical protein n=1 Tax=Streptomyces sp. B1866 TaxID=3075431 RepID=UPI00288F6EC4|nr:hypothetical protein [Streptomyces sp. B1866]MDT3397035.1 hypothetical protein [Streptomyces sp. B1866]